MHALVVLHGDPGGSEAWLAARAQASALVVAADGGALVVAAAGRVPDLVIGDLDSISADERARLERAGAHFEMHPQDKDRTDGELAVAAAVRRGADEIDVVGAFGGSRLDHLAGNLLLLAHPDFAAVELALLFEGGSFRAIRGQETLTLHGAPGDIVTLVPLTERARGVRTDGLRWALPGEDLVRGSTRGVSNELLGETASVGLDEGLLLVATQQRAPR